MNISVLFAKSYFQTELELRHLIKCDLYQVCVCVCVCLFYWIYHYIPQSYNTGSFIVILIMLFEVFLITGRVRRRLPRKLMEEKKEKGRQLRMRVT